ncbi:hypothetical protein HRbin10_02317 [bacterium HR10]|nr:hypothetical protein HRbin10_02317 [bacterium HR10]
MTRMMAHGGEGLWEKLSRLSPHADPTTLLQDLRHLDREFEHLPSDQRLLFLAEMLRKRQICSSFQECLEVAALWMSSDLCDRANQGLAAEPMRASPASAGGEGAVAPATGLAVEDSPARPEAKEPHAGGGREELIRELIRMIVAQIEASCGWSERELVSVERDGVVQMLELLRLLRAEPEFFDYAIEAMRELLDRLEAERKAQVRGIGRETLGPRD